MGPQVVRGLHWLPIEKQIVFKLLLLMYKSLNNAAPIYLHVSELRKPYHPKANLHYGMRELLLVLRNRLQSYGDRVFSITGKLWNTLPNYTRTTVRVVASKKFSALTAGLTL